MTSTRPTKFLFCFRISLIFSYSVELLIAHYYYYNNLPICFSICSAVALIERRRRHLMSFTKRTCYCERVLSSLHRKQLWSHPMHFWCISFPILSITSRNYFKY